MEHLSIRKLIFEYELCFINFYEILGQMEFIYEWTDWSVFKRDQRDNFILVESSSLSWSNSQFISSLLSNSRTIHS